jgi:hypothetical protein
MGSQHLPQSFVPIPYLYTRDNLRVTSITKAFNPCVYEFLDQYCRLSKHSSSSFTDSLSISGRIGKYISQPYNFGRCFTEPQSPCDKGHAGGDFVNVFSLSLHLQSPPDRVVIMDRERSRRSVYNHTPPPLQWESPRQALRLVIAYKPSPQGRNPLP